MLSVKRVAKSIIEYNILRAQFILYMCTLKCNEHNLATTLCQRDPAHIHKTKELCIQALQTTMRNITYLNVRLPL